jgi:cytochrome P450
MSSLKTTTSIAYFFLAMLLYPETQKKAQLELDSLLEGKRLPEFSDMEHLPYIKAMVSEVMRWRPVTPLGVPHCSSVEDIYEGHHIPKGTILVGNVWAILHDEDTYGVDHLEFNPDRFLPKEGKAMPPDPSVAAFGFGRRSVHAP